MWVATDPRLERDTGSIGSVGNWQTTLAQNEMMLRVRTALLSHSRSIYALAEQPGVLATLSRWRSWVQIPSGALSECEIVARYANRQSGHDHRAVPKPW